MVREFRLSPVRSGRGVSCDAHGAFIGSIPLLKRVGEKKIEVWAPRSCEDLSAELSLEWDLPINVKSRAGGLNAIARALNEGDLARAQIATVLLAIPQPPALEKGTKARDSLIRFIRELYLGNLIKADWDPDAHPRWPAGAPDSQGGQFAPKDQGATGAAAIQVSGDTAIDRDSSNQFLQYGAEEGHLDDGVYRPDTDPAEIDPATSTPEQLKQNWQQHQDEVDRQIRLLESKSYGALKVTRNVSFIGRNGVRVTVDYVVSRWLPDGIGGFWLVPDYGADVKTGRGGLRDSQSQVYPKIGSRTWVFPVGANAISAGFEPDTWAYFPIVYGDALSTTEH